MIAALRLAPYLISGVAVAALAALAWSWESRGNRIDELAAELSAANATIDAHREAEAVLNAPSLKPQTLEEARALIPGADAYALEAEWRAMWARSGRPRLRQADAAFLGWVKKRGSE